MRCREVDALWDDVRGDCTQSLKDAVHAHLRTCPPCQDLFEEYEGVAFRLSRLPEPEPSCDLAKRVVEHIAYIKGANRTEPILIASVPAPIGRLFVGFRDHRIAFVAIDTGKSLAHVRESVERRLRRPTLEASAPAWLQAAVDEFFHTWRIDAQLVDTSDLTPFERAALQAAARIPPGEVRSYAWVASQIGRPRAARAVGRAMARNPLPLLLPCHRVVDSSGNLHNYGYGLEMKARLLQMEGFRTSQQPT